MLGRWLKKQLVQQLYTWTWASQHTDTAAVRTTEGAAALAG
jgi:hypothetical protein